MGTVFGGSVADYTLYSLGERSWATLRTVQLEHEIVGWARYKDDILVACDNPVKAHRFINEFMARVACCWKVKHPVARSRPRLGKGLTQEEEARFLTGPQSSVDIP